MIAYTKDGVVVSYKKPSAGTKAVPVVVEGGKFDPVTESLLGPEITIEADRVRFVYTKVLREDAVEAKQAYLLGELNYLLESKTKSLSDTYPAIEVATWEQQRLEAVAYSLDSSASTPILSQIATGRGMDLGVLVDKVLVKTSMFTNLVGGLIGRKQALEDLVEAGSDLTELARIELEEFVIGW